jgi:hypothetical protein
MSATCGAGTVYSFTEYLSSLSGFSEVRVPRSLLFCVVHCTGAHGMELPPPLFFKFMFIYLFTTLYI